MNALLNIFPAGLVLFFLSGDFSPARGADIFYDIEAKGTYESNVVGLLSGHSTGGGGPAGGPQMAGIATAPTMTGQHRPQDLGTQSSSDTAYTLGVELGASAKSGENMTVFLAGSAQHTVYSSFTDLNVTSGSVIAGVSENPTEDISAKLALTMGIKRYGDQERDSSVYGGWMLLKEWLAKGPVAEGTLYV